MSVADATGASSSSRDRVLEERKELLKETEPAKLKETLTEVWKELDESEEQLHKQRELNEKLIASLTEVNQEKARLMEENQRQLTRIRELEAATLVVRVGEDDEQEMIAKDQIDEEEDEKEEVKIAETSLDEDPKGTPADTIHDSEEDSEETAEEEGDNGDNDDNETEIAPNHRRNWQIFVVRIIRLTFRGYFGLKKLNHWGFFLDRNLSAMITDFSDWVDYPEGDRILRGHKTWILGAVISEDGHYLFTGSQKIICWDMTTLEMVHEWDPVGSLLCLVGKRRWLASSHLDGTIRLWNAHTLKLKHELKGHSDEVTELAFNRTATFLISGSGDKTVRLWEMHNGQCLITFTGHTDPVTSLLFLRDRVVSGSIDQSVKRWNAKHGGCEMTITKGINGSSNGFSLNCDRSLMACLVFASSIVVFDSREFTVSYRIRGDFAKMVFHPSHPHLMAVAEKKPSWVSVRNVMNGEVLIKLGKHPKPIDGLCFTPDSRRLISVGRDRSIRIWDLCLLSLSEDFIIQK